MLRTHMQQTSSECAEFYPSLEDRILRVRSEFVASVGAVLYVICKQVIQLSQKIMVDSTL